MESSAAVQALGALAHDGRLKIYRLLVQAGPDGLAAGEIARRLGLLPNTLSNSLNILSAAGLITARRQGRSIVYSPAFDQMRELLAFLMDDCCNGNPQVCAPLAAAASAVCGPDGACA